MIAKLPYVFNYAIKCHVCINGIIIIGTSKLRGFGYNAYIIILGYFFLIKCSGVESKTINFIMIVFDNYLWWTFEIRNKFSGSFFNFFTSRLTFSLIQCLNVRWCSSWIHLCLLWGLRWVNHAKCSLPQQ